MQMKTRILFILLAASSLFACSEEGSGGGDDMHPFFHKTYVRFISPAGTNVIDSLGVLNMKEERYVLFDKSKLMTVTATRMSDGQLLEVNHSAWIWAEPTDNNYLVPDSYVFLPYEETIASLEWVDFNPCNLEKHPYNYDEIYEIRLNSQQLFGSTGSHTLRWYAKVNGRVINAYKCEVDGQEISLDDDPFYNYTSPYWVHHSNKSANALVEITCK